jgi:hypothetical protein
MVTDFVICLIHVGFAAESDGVNAQHTLEALDALAIRKPPAPPPRRPLPRRPGTTSGMSSTLKTRLRRGSTSIWRCGRSTPGYKVPAVHPLPVRDGEGPLDAEVWQCPGVQDLPSRMTSHCAVSRPCCPAPSVLPIAPLTAGGELRRDGASPAGRRAHAAGLSAPGRGIRQCVSVLPRYQRSCLHSTEQLESPDR